MADLSGRTFGQYQLIEPISAGGMAAIYKAYQPALDRIVAIKVLPEFLLSQAGFLERFRIEAQAIAKLDHPHILPIYDYGEAERTPYLVMKYVPSGTLKDLIAQGPIGPRQAVPLLRQMAEALDHAHQQGIIHRDVKPSNVLLQDNRWVQLMDFGLAKMLTSTSNITASGTGVGTPDYMSPEQAQGLPVDQRTDIYALGIVLYQMLTGDVPFHAETPMAVMLKHIAEPPPAPRLKKPDIREATEDVILKALAKAPQDRFVRAIDLADAYESSLDSGATLTVAQPPSLSTLPVTPAIEPRRSPWLIGVGLVAALAAVIAIIALIVGATNTRPGGTPSAGQLGATLLDDFSVSTINPSVWYYSGTFTATLDSPAVAIQNGRVTFDVQNAVDEFYDGGLRYDAPRPFTTISAKVTLLDATGFSDIGLEVNGLDNEPDAWAYLAMAPSDGSVVAYVGHNSTGTEQTFTLLQGSGMPATHDLAIGWDGSQITFYVDGQARKSLPTKERGQWAWLFFDVEPTGNLSGSFDDVRITYAE